MKYRVYVSLAAEKGSSVSLTDLTFNVEVVEGANELTALAEVQNFLAVKFPGRAVVSAQLFKA